MYQGPFKKLKSTGVHIRPRRANDVTNSRPENRRTAENQLIKIVCHQIAVAYFHLEESKPID